MIVKDYYKILDVKPSATTGEIKKNYRRLAMKYHPDKGESDTLGASVFGEITEAYKILSDPAKRQEYNYSRFNVFSTTYQAQPETTRASLLAAINQLEKKVASADPFRINRDALYFNLQQILTGRNTSFIKEQPDTFFKKHVIEQLLHCSRLLTLTDLEKVAGDLYLMAGEDQGLRGSIDEFVHHAKRAGTWNKYKTLVAVGIALALCLLVFLLSR